MSPIKPDIYKIVFLITFYTDLFNYALKLLLYFYLLILK